MKTIKQRLGLKSILNPAFRYTPSHATDVRATFERARKEMAIKDAAEKDRQRLIRSVR